MVQQANARCHALVNRASGNQHLLVLDSDIVMAPIATAPEVPAASTSELVAISGCNCEGVEFGETYDDLNKKSQFAESHNDQLN